MAIVASLMIGWGLILVAAGLFTGSRPAADSSPLGNGTAPLLGVGGTATALLGLGLMVLASRRNWFPSTFPLALLSWLGFLMALGILACGIINYDPRRNVPLVLAAGLALAVSVIGGCWSDPAGKGRRPARSLPELMRTAKGLDWATGAAFNRLTSRARSLRQHMICEPWVRMG